MDGAGLGQILSNVQLLSVLVDSSNVRHNMTTLLHKLIIWYLFVVHIGCLVTSATHMRMTNKHFKIAAIHRPPFLIAKTLPGGQNILSGQNGDAINFWQYARNFTYTLVKPKDGLYGACLGPNNCSGLIGMVQRKEVDFALGLC